MPSYKLLWIQMSTKPDKMLGTISNPLTYNIHVPGSTIIKNCVCFVGIKTLGLLQVTIPKREVNHSWLTSLVTTPSNFGGSLQISIIAKNK
jgi:hypothetical protein